jgi:hypothetical protein
MNPTEQSPSPCLQKFTHYSGLFIYIAFLFATYSILGEPLTKLLTAMLEARSSYRESSTYARYFILTNTEEGSLWFYPPNKGAAIAFAILFAISGGIHGYQC